MKSSNFKNLILLLAVFAVFGIFVALGSATGQERHFICAGIFYALGALCLLYSLLTRGSGSWRSGIPMSLMTRILFVNLFFVAGTVELGSGFGWSFFIGHGDVICSAALGLVLIAGAYDWFIYRRDY